MRPALVFPRFLGTVFILNAALSPAFAQAPVVGPNVNMVSGTQWPTGDPFLQRQNEPSIAVSTRNPQHLLAGANDYRTVDLPMLQDFLPSDKMAGDAWPGFFKSSDGGQTWISSLLPCFPQDNSPACLNSPLRGFAAGADPVVRAGTHGMFYYSGIIFNRGPNAQGVLQVSRLIDTNNNENGDTIHYLSTSIVDRGTAGQFMDKPWMAVDIPRAGAATCSVGPIDGTAIPAFPAGNVYVTYAIFLGSDVVNRSKIMFARSTDCGATFQTPIKLSEGYPVGQGSVVAVDPASGAVYVVWRTYPINSSDKNDLVFAKSTDGGRTFTKPASVLGAFVLNPFDQSTSSTLFRTQTLPAVAVDASGVVYVAWSQLGMPGSQDARIAITKSRDQGVTWSAPVVADPNTGRGHQLMPALSFNQDRLTLAYYDLRWDHEVGYLYCPPGPGCMTISDYWPAWRAEGELITNPGRVFTPTIDDAGLTMRRHTLDVQVAQAVSGPQFTGQFPSSVTVSKYIWGTPAAAGAPPNIEQLQFNVPNLPMFKQGTVPFMGDYIDVTGASVFVPASSTSDQWVYNTSPSKTTPHHVTWTDNRDVQPPADGNWQNYTPISGYPGPSVFDPSQSRPICSAGQAGMRNQNIYTARLSDGLVAGTPWNTKPLGQATFEGQTFLIQRAFSVFVQNLTGVARTVTLSISAPSGVTASFQQFAAQPSLVLTIQPQSSEWRTVYVSASDPKATVTVNVSEGGVATGSVILNPSITNPSITNPSITNPSITNPSITNAEVYNPSITNPSITNPSITNPSITNPSITNPSITNPSITNPSITNGVIYNPSITNPSITNPSITNPSITNPSITNPSITNPSITNGAIADGIWKITNHGNTAASYDVKFQTSGVAGGIVLQLIVYRLYTNPVAAGCELQVEPHAVPVASIPNPVLDPSITNATLGLAPEESAYVVLRVVDPTPIIVNGTRQVRFDFTTAAVPVVSAQAVNTEDVLNGSTTPPSATPPFRVMTAFLPAAMQATPYLAPQLAADGGRLPYTWSIVSGALPAGITLSANGTFSGSATGAGSTFTVQVTDADGLTATRVLSISVIPIQPLPFWVSFEVQPSNATAGAAILPAVKVKAQTMVSILPNIPVSLIIYTNPGGGMLSATLPQMTDASGIATFSDLRIDKPGVGYRLIAWAPDIFAAVSAPFDILGFSASAPMTVARDGHTATLLPNGDVLITGGSGAAGSTTEIHRMPLGAGTLVAITASMTTPRHRHRATLLPNGKVLIAGGENSTALALATAELFSPFPSGEYLFGTFASTGSMTTPRSLFTATLLPNGKVLVAGGENASGVPLNTAELYDPATGLFTATGSMTTARVGHTATLLPNGKVLISGGADSVAGPWGHVAATAELYDPGAGTFSAAATMGIGRYAHTATLLPNGKVLLAGGTSSLNTDDTLASAELYDPAANTFAPTGSMAGARARHTETLLVNGTVLITGGLKCTCGLPVGFVTLSTTEIYDPAAGAFRPGPVMGAARAYHTATRLVSGAVLVAGGGDWANPPLASTELFPSVNPPFMSPGFAAAGSMSSVRQLHTETVLPDGRVLLTGGILTSGLNTNTAEVYNPATGAYTSVGPMNTSRSHHTATLLPNGKVLIAGGENVTLPPPAELFDPGSNTFVTTGTMSVARVGHTATLLPNGKVLIAGGFISNAARLSLASTELYDPATGTFSAPVSMLTARDNHTATLLPTGKVLIAGGLNWNGSGWTELASAEVYDPALNSFTATGSMSTPRFGHQATQLLFLGSKVLISGGDSTRAPGGIVATAELYDPYSGTFSLTGSMSIERDGHRATRLPNGRVLVTGGNSNTGLPFLASAEIYDPLTAAFTPAGSMSTTRLDHGAALLPNGKVFVSGGGGGASGLPLSSAELFSPGP